MVDRKHRLTSVSLAKQCGLSYTGAGRAVDGRFTNLNFDGGQCAASQEGQTEEWQVDLGDIKIIRHALIQYSRDERNEQIQTNTNENIWLDKESNPGHCITSQMFYY